MNELCETAIFDPSRSIEEQRREWLRVNHEQLCQDELRLQQICNMATPYSDGLSTRDRSANRLVEMKTAAYRDRLRVIRESPVADINQRATVTRSDFAVYAERYGTPWIKEFAALWLSIPCVIPETARAAIVQQAPTATTPPVPTPMLGTLACTLPDNKAREYFEYISFALKLWPNEDEWWKFWKRKGEKATWGRSATLVNKEFKSYTNGRGILSGSYKQLRTSGRKIPGLPECWKGKYDDKR